MHQNSTQAPSQRFYLRYHSTAPWTLHQSAFETTQAHHTDLQLTHLRPAPAHKCCQKVQGLIHPPTHPPIHHISNVCHAHPPTRSPATLLVNHMLPRDPPAVRALGAASPVCTPPPLHPRTATGAAAAPCWAHTAHGTTTCKCIHGHIMQPQCTLAYPPPHKPSTHLQCAHLAQPVGCVPLFLRIHTRRQVRRRRLAGHLQLRAQQHTIAYMHILC